jgi:hypothetical protein
LPKTLKRIDWDVFGGCTSLKELVLPDGLESIGNHSFFRCSSLESLIIPESVTLMGQFLFEGCQNLTIYCEADYMPDSWQRTWNYTNLPVVWGFEE